jgi:Flp pilus assembly protein TadD
MSGDLEGAVKEFRHATALQPKQPERHVELGQALALTGRLADGERELRRGIELGVTKADPHILLARVLWARGRREETIAELRRALAIMDDTRTQGELQYALSHRAPKGATPRRLTPHRP